MSTPSAFYIEKVSSLERPPPYPPRYLKRQIYTDPAVFGHIDSHAINEARTNYRNFRDLMWNLVCKQNYNDLEKARAIFRWLTTKNLYTIMFDSQIPGSPEQTIVAFKDGKTTYANIFECLAIHAGLHCVTLSGWAKGVDCKPGSPITSSPCNHSWNSVLIDGCWQLVDCHWATRYLQSDRNRTDSLVYEYDDFYFLTEPAMLIYSHCPTETAWQLLHPVRSKSEYEEYPLVKSFFFTVGMQFLQQNRGVLFTKRGIVTVTLGFIQPMAFTFKLGYGDAGVDVLQGVPLKRYIIQETTDNRVTFYFRSPREGTYYLTVFAQRLSANGKIDNIYKAACEYKINCDRAASDPQPFPVCADLNWGAGTVVDQYGLIPSHKVALLAAPNGRAEVSFIKSRFVRLHAKLIREGIAELVLEKYVNVTEQDNQIIVSVRLPVVGEYGLEVYASEPQRDGDTYSHICQFLCAFTDRDFSVLYGQVFDRSDLAYGMQAGPLLYTTPASHYTTTMSRHNGSLRMLPEKDQRDKRRTNKDRQFHSMRTDIGKQSAQVSRRPRSGDGFNDSLRRPRSDQENVDVIRRRPQSGEGTNESLRRHVSDGRDIHENSRRPRSGEGVTERQNSRREKTKNPQSDPLEIVYVTNITEKVEADRKKQDAVPLSPVEIVYIKPPKSAGKSPLASTKSPPSSAGTDTSPSTPLVTTISSPPVRPPRQQDLLKLNAEILSPPPASFQPVPIHNVTEAPNPAPPEISPVKSFTDRSIFQTVDLHAVEVSKEEHHSFRDLVWHLIYAKDIKNELDKARAIFLWLCSKDLTRLTFDTIQKGSPEEILINLQRSQTTYAVVYEILCSYAGLHCKTISGYAKGAEYRPGMKFTGELGQHSWNAVLVNQSWRLVDCHWAARRLVGKKVTPENVRYELDEYYFMPDPHQLIFTHFPEDSDWQLLEHPISLSEFENLVPVKSSFFKYGLQVLDYREAVIHVQDEVTVRISCPASKAQVLSFTYSLMYENGCEEFDGIKLNQFGMHEMLDAVSYFTIRPPSKATFRLIIYAKDSNQEPLTRDGVYGAVCEYAVVCEIDPVHPKPFPPCVQTSWGTVDSVNKYRLEPLQKGAVFCTTDGQLELKFHIMKELRFSTKLRTATMNRDGRSLEGCVMHRIINGDIARFTVSVPGPGEYGLEIYANDPEVDGTALYHVYQYLVICNELTSGPSKPLPSLPSGYLGPQQLFHKYGITCASHGDPYISTDNGEIQVTFLTSLPVRMTSQLLLAAKNDNDDRECYEYVLQQCRGTSSVAFHIRLPKTGLYKFQIYAVPLSDVSDNLPNVFNCLIECTGVRAAVIPFPKQFGQWKDGCFLHEPINGHIRQSSDTIYFKVDVPRANAVAVVVGEDWTQLETRGRPGSVWEGEVNMEEFWGRESKVFVCANYGSVSSSYYTLLEYMM